LKPKPRVPLWRWAVWWLALAAALLLFYVLLTPIWIGLRAAAWVAEFRARRRGSNAPR
jgi:predicted membrane metal-binding protein